MWPVLSILILIIFAVGWWVGQIEGWATLDALYFACVTAMTIGYGDLTPSRDLSKVLAIVIGLDGFLVTGMLIAVAVKALHATLTAIDAIPPSAPPQDQILSDRNGPLDDPGGDRR